jgi:hypothetical protein
VNAQRVELPVSGQCQPFTLAERHYMLMSVAGGLLSDSRELAAEESLGLASGAPTLEDLHRSHYR